MTDSPRPTRPFILRIGGHVLMRILEALALGWVVWFTVDVILLAGSEDPGATSSAWLHFVKNGAWEFWEHLALIDDSAVRSGTWWLVIACLALVSFQRYRPAMAKFLES
ncbi:MAG: hypothetical protein CMJ24_11935 [Phycisphaerae bacterium]|nr:hypothetical protein [Phycisphaerae bacterium]|tara:strand:- start:5139 stop:5465 length:327 start_codon:yes stop_codon:yes gene_type:complete